MLTHFTYKLLQPTKLFFAALLVFLAVGVESVSGQATYTWQGGNSSWATSTNWTPIRTTPAANDILLFNTGTTLTITNVPTQTIGRFVMSNNTNITLLAAAVINLTIGNGTGTDLDIPIGSNLTIGTNVSITLNASATATIAGNLTVNSGRTFNTNGTTVVTTVTGSIINSGTVTCTTATKLLFQSGAIYQHAVNNVTLPTATWDAASNCNVTGVTANAVTVPSQTFGNFTWNCTGQGANNLDVIFTSPQSFGGNFSVLSTGASGSIQLTQNTARTINIAGDFILSGGILNMSRGNQSVTMNVAKNFSHTGGTLTESGSASGIINFNGINQTYTSGGTVSSIINFTVNSGATLQMAADATVVGNGSTGTFSIASGATLGVTSPDGITTSGGTGNIRVTGTRTYTSGANYIYNGGANQNTGNGLTQNTPANLTLNNANTVTLSAATPISGNLLISQGTLSTSVSNFAMTVGGNWTNGGTFTAGSGTVTMTGTSKTIGGSASTTFNNLSLTGTASVATGVSTTIGGNLDIANGTTFTAAGFALTVTGTTTVGGGTSGNLTISSSSGAKIFTGLVTIATGATWNNSGNSAVEFRGGITTTPTFTGGSGVHTFTSNTQALSGTFIIPSLTSNIALTNNGTLTVGTALAGSGSLINAATGTLNISGSCSIATLTNNGIVNSSGSGTTTSATITNNLTYNMSGTGTVTAFTNNAAGVLNISTTPTIPAITTLNVSAAGNIVNYNGAGDQTIINANYSNLIIQGTGIKSVIGGTVGATISLTGTGSLTNAASGTLNISGTCSVTTLTNNGIVNSSGTGATTSTTVTNNLTYNMSGTGTVTAFTNSVSGVLNISATPTVPTFTTLTVSAIGNTVIYNGAGPQTIKDVTYSNLTLAGGGAKSLNAATTVNAALTLTSALLTLGNFNLTLGPLTPAVIGTFSATNMIVTNGNGEVRKSLTSNISYTFPIGETTGTAEYSPVTVDFASGTYSSAYVGVKVTDAIHPSYTPGANYITRYWTVTQSGISLFSATVTGTFVAADVVGTTGNIVTARYAGATRFDGATATTISATNQLILGDYTGINNVPLITTSIGSLLGFTYVGGLGPSTEQSFTVRGDDMFTNITVTAPASFEISRGTGNLFFPSSQLALNVANSTVPTTTIYVRMKSGLSIGAIGPENIVCTATSAVTKNVACSGDVIITPLITISTPTLSGFNYIFGSGPSTGQSFTVSGSNLTNDIVITPPTNYEIGNTAIGGPYQITPISYAHSGGIVTSKTIYVRLKSTLVVGAYNENVTITSTNAVTKTVASSGSVTAATVSVSKFVLGGFIYTSGAGPSGEQTFVVSGSSLSNDIVLTPPANFQISQTSGSGFVSSPSTITLTRTGNTVAPTTIYVRMTSGLGVATYGPLNLTAASVGAITQNIICSGQVVSTATSISSNSTLNGFAYTLGNGPSIIQSYTVSATSLTSSITVTPPATNFEICLTEGGTYVSTALTIPQSGGKVNAVPVYVRLKGGLPVATYGPQNIVMSSTGAANVNVTCNGIVVTGPTIVAGPTGLENACNGSNITLTSVGTGITNQYWTGPHGYADTQNLPLGNVAPSQNGTYTVTGSALSGVNILTNGDFESGNTGFGSTYGYVTPAVAALYPEGIYTITNASFPTAATMHNDFSACADNSNPGSYQMVINGKGTAGEIVWSQSVSVVPNADYQFSYYLTSVHPTSPSVLQLYVNGVPAGPNYTASSSTCVWNKFTYNTNAGSNQVMQLTLINQNIQLSGNDFALDDMFLQQVFPVSSSVNLVVNPILAPSLVVTASDNPVFTGTAVTFTATPTNGGVTPTYQWSVAGTPVPGATSSTYNYTPTNGQIVSCVMTSTYPCASPLTATSQVTMTVNPRFNFWKGTVSTAWNVLANWTAGYVPSPGDDVEYATVANNGSDAVNDLQVDQDRTIGYLINATSKALIIPPAKGLTVNETVQTDGDVTRVQILASTTLPNGSLIFHNPEIQPVYATVQMYSGASWNLGAAQGSRYQWQYFGTPIKDFTAEFPFQSAYVRKWNEAGPSIATHWVQQQNASIIQPFVGYELVQAAPKFYYFQGALVNSDFSSGRLAYTASALYPGQHIFANPYTAAIDITQLTFGSQTEETIYLYNTGSFNIWTSNNGQGTGGTNANPGQYYAIPKNQAGFPGLQKQVPSMNAMLIKAMSNSVNATFGISYNAVHSYNTTVQRAPSSNTDNVGTIIDVRGEHGADKMWVISHPECTRAFDNGWDGQKIIGSALVPQLFAIEKDGYYQVNTLSDINDTYLGFQAGQDSEYTLTFTHENIEKQYAGLFLVDMLENKTLDITNTGSTYSFVATNTAEPVKRFKIVTRHYEKDAADNESQLKLFSSQGMVFVQNLSNEDGECALYDISGRYLMKVPFGASTVTMVSNKLKPGAYIARSETSLEKVSKRLIVR